jgi:hypothetical protein
MEVNEPLVAISRDPEEINQPSNMTGLDLWILPLSVFA